jgi:hypothetical protein
VAEMEKNNQLYICKTLRMMNYLCKKYDCIKMADDKDNLKFKVFLFEDTDEFREYLSKYDNGLNK